MMASPLSIASSRGRNNGFAQYGSPLSWGNTYTKDYSMSRELSKGGLNADSTHYMFDHPTPTSFSHLAFLSTSASSFTSDSGERLPKLEQSFCKGYSCCGLELDDLHGLLEHFEEHHVLGSSPAGSLRSTQMASSLPQSIKSPRSVGQVLSLNSATPPPSSAQQNKVSPLTEQNVAAASASFPAGAPFSMDDMDMDMDVTDDSANSGFANTPSMAGPSSKAFNFTGALGRTRPLHPLAFSTRRSASPKSTTTSPEASAPNTPTMDSDMESDFDPSASSSSLNLFPPLGTITPAMLFPQSSRPPSQSPPAEVPVSSAPPAETFSQDSLAQLSMQTSTVSTQPAGAAIIMGDDPTSTSLAPVSLGAGQQGFVAPPPTMPSGRVWTPPASKPFKCPVAGCDKAYKQQNGLKYHRLHGHCNNRGRDPATTGGEEDGRETLEEKPFGCYVGQACGKRYKNMNGLRYHYQHSGPHGQIGLEMLAMGTHPAPLTPAGARSRPTSAASSRNNSRANSPAPSPLMQAAPQPAPPQLSFAPQAFPGLPMALSGH